MLTLKNNSEIYIFAAMDANAGYALLKNMATELPHIAEVKELQKHLWLLRESNKQTGMLTADIIRWDPETLSWREFSLRMVLHLEKGWINAGNIDCDKVKDAIKSMQHVNRETASAHEDSLLAYLKTIKFPLLVEYRLNPPKHLQTQSFLYCDYISFNCTERPYQKVITQVTLPPAIIQAISCEITGKILNNPVVLKRNMTISSLSQHDMHLSQGKSYESSELEKRNISVEDYYPNFVLRKVINRLGSNNVGLIENLDLERLIDPVMLETLMSPHIIPSGHSLSKSTIQSMLSSGRSLKCPQTQKPFSIEDAILNINLDRFIRAWPEGKTLMLTTLNQFPQSKADEKKYLSP